MTTIWLAGLITTQFELPHDKTNKVAVRPAKTQISLGIRLAWSESSLCAQWVAKDPSILHADSEDSDQPESSLGAHSILLVLSWDGAFIVVTEGKANECGKLTE